MYIERLPERFKLTMWLEGMLCLGYSVNPAMGIESAMTLYCTEHSETMREMFVNHCSNIILNIRGVGRGDSVSVAKPS